MPYPGELTECRAELAKTQTRAVGFRQKRKGTLSVRAMRARGEVCRDGLQLEHVASYEVEAGNWNRAIDMCSDSESDNRTSVAVERVD